MTRVALTGGSGFVGANLARALLRSGFEVHLLNRKDHIGWRIEGIKDDVRAHVVDLADTAAVDSVVRAVRPELMFHLAQYGGYSWQTDADAMIRTNYLAGVNLLRAAENADVGAFINTGSSSEYGLKSHPTVESDCLEPNSDYAATKAGFTLYCQQWARRTGRKAPTLRLYSVYGPFEEPMRLMPRLLCEGLAGRWPPLAAPATARDFIFIADVIDAYLRAAQAELPDPGAIYNICSGRQTTLQEAIDTVRTVLDVRAEPVWNSMAPRVWDTDIWCGDPSRALKDIGWHATTSLPFGLRQFADWICREPKIREYYQKTIAHPGGPI
jgi:nucleoside-diphosphate-sugar epimerase